MIKKNKIIIALTLLLGLNFLFTPVTEAKSVSWNKFYPTLLLYDDAFNPGFWVSGMIDFDVTVKYFAKVINLDTGQEIVDGSNVNIGTKLKFEFADPKDTDISWFGTGYAFDSPYGSWVNNATGFTFDSKIVCPQKYFINKLANTFSVGMNYYIYIPLNVNPPQKNITHLGTAQLSCNSNNSECVVLSAGTIIPKFNFLATYGKFYHAYDILGGAWVDTSGCIQPPYNQPMKKIKDKKNYDLFVGDNITYRYMCGPNPAYGDLCSDLLEPGDFLVSVPAQTISYSFSAISPGKPPTTPVINLVSGLKNIKESLTFSFVSTDPEKDKIKYLIDWNADDEVDIINTTTDFTNSGTPATSPKSWLTGGSKRIKAKAQDEGGNMSDWGYYTFTIDPCVSTKGGACSATNTCGTNTGVIACDGSCSVLPPVIPVGYGSKCTATNMCGMTNPNAKIGCDAKCAPAPSDSLCLIDSGVRIDQGGGDIVKIAADPTLNPKSPVRVMTKDGVRSIPVTSNFSDPGATKIRIMTKDGIRALIKYISN